MPKVLVIVGSADEMLATSSSVAVQMVNALKQAIAQPVQIDSSSSEPAFSVETIDVADLERDAQLLSSGLPDYLLCPMTLNMPSWVAFPAQSVFEACRDVAKLRQTVADWGYTTGSGDLWLPIVLTRKGPLYAEVIGVPAGLTLQEGMSSGCYVQPVHLTDAWRQPIYQLGHRLLRSLSAPPAAYLLQFGLSEQGIQFDRLIPFPDAPAIASIEHQQPNLFECHWRCLTGQPIRDLLIATH